MIIVQTKHLTVKTRYYVNNNGQHSYQRAIPKDLRQYFDNKSNIVRKLKGTEKTLAAEIARLAADDDRLFSELRGGAGLSKQREALANALLERYGLRPSAGLETADVPEGAYNQPHLADIEHYLEMRQASGQYDEVDRVARLLLTNSVPLMLSQAIEIYLEHHKSGQLPTFSKDERNRWARVVKVIGDIPLLSLSRAHAKSYVSARAKEVLAATVDREVKAIRAVLNVVIRERELDLKNPFERVTIPGLGEGSKRRLPFTIEEHRALINACLKQPDDIRVIALLCCVTGARIGEIVGLRVEDVAFDRDIPFISISPHDKRSLKTKGSVRSVPIIPAAAGVLRSYLESLSGRYVFSRYCSDEGLARVDSASVTVNKFVARHAPGKTIHCARHAVRDLLRNANVTRDVAQEIGGWGRRQIDDNYGVGLALEIKYSAIVKAMDPVI